MGKWVVKSVLVNVASYLSRKYTKEALHFGLRAPQFNPRVLRPLLQGQALIFSVLLLEKATYLRKFVRHLLVNHEYARRYFSVSFLGDFVVSLGRAFALVRKPPGALLAQEEIQTKLKFRKVDARRKRAILESLTRVPENDKWGQGFFKSLSNRFGVHEEFLRLYRLLARSRAELSVHRDLPVKVGGGLVPDSSTRCSSCSSCSASPPSASTWTSAAFPRRASRGFWPAPPSWTATARTSPSSSSSRRYRPRGRNRRSASNTFAKTAAAKRSAASHFQCWSCPSCSSPTSPFCKAFCGKSANPGKTSAPKPVGNAPG